MIVGLDFSLTATGVCAITDGEAECITVKSRKEDVWHEFPDRVHGIAFDIEAWLGDASPLLVIESPAFAATSSSLDRMFGGWWMFVDTLMNSCGYEPPLLVTPTQVKKFATGKGGGLGTGKVEVALGIAKLFPDVALHNADEADALVLAAIGAAAHNEPFMGTLTKQQLEVVEAVVSRGKEI